jgi:hypothetical protein
MNNKVAPEKYRKLSIASLVTGILAVSLAGLYNFLWMPVSNILQNSLDMRIIPYFIVSFICIVLGLSIAAVVCGSIDLKRIKAGLYSKKGKGFDISGIVLGSVFILFALFFAFGEIIVPH